MADDVCVQGAPKRAAIDTSAPSDAPMAMYSPAPDSGGPTAAVKAALREIGVQVNTTARVPCRGYSAADVFAGPLATHYPTTYHSKRSLPWILDINNDVLFAMDCRRESARFRFRFTSSNDCTLVNRVR